MVAAHSQSSERDSLLLVAVILSLIIHGTILKLLPGFSFAEQRKDESLTIELAPPPKPEPKPLPPPEPRQPEPIQPKIPPVTKPKVEPVRHEPPPLPRVDPTPTMPVTTHSVEPTTPAVIAAPAQPTTPPTGVTAPVATEPTTTPVPKGPSDDDINAARRSYGELLSQELAKHKEYPPRALRFRRQGTVRIEVVIDSNGQLASVKVVESSGVEDLDNKALEMAQKYHPPVTEALRGKESRFVAPVIFRLE